MPGTISAHTLLALVTWPHLAARESGKEVFVPSDPFPA